MQKYLEDSADPVDGEVASATNGAATVTIEKSSRAAEAIFITKVTFSAKAAPAAAVQATIKADATTKFAADIPDAKFAPITFSFEQHPLKITNADAVVTLPALGAGVQGTVAVTYYRAAA
jgi:hypothetical protein